MTFVPADIVTLTSGGPDMTVESAGPDGIWCVWFESKRCHRKLFAAALLKKRESVARQPHEINIAFVGPAGNVTSTMKLGGKAN
jgi:uncharacterized protein YodC (DUF2158 family)